MLELLKKVGLPATVAAVIATLVTVTPLLFKIDERYAKDSEVTALEARTEKAINSLTTEVAKLSGSQDAMVQIMVSQENRRAARDLAKATEDARVARTIVVPTPTPAPAPIVLAPLPVKPASAPEVRKLEDVSRALKEQQSRVQSLKY